MARYRNGKRKCHRTGKSAFHCYSAAKVDLDAIRREGSGDTTRLAIYRCTACGLYHVGNKPRKRKR